MSNAIENLFNEMGIDLTTEDFTDDSGFSTTADIENPNSAIRGLELDFDKKSMLITPLILRIPFNPATGNRLPKGQVFSTAGRSISPDDILKAICDQAENDSEYKSKILSILLRSGRKEPSFAYDETGFDPDLVDLFITYLSPMFVSEVCQRFKVSEDKTVSCKALLKTNEFGKIDFNKSDPRLVMRYTAEAAMLRREIELATQHYVAANLPKKEIESNIDTIKDKKVMTPPRPVSVAVAFAFDSDSSGKIKEEPLSFINNTSNNIAYTLRTFGTGQTFAKTIQEIMASNDFRHISYVSFMRKVPAKATDVPNLGQASLKTTFEALGSKVNAESQILNLAERVNEVLRAGNVITEERILGSVTKFQEMSIDDALNCFTSGLTQYTRVLDDREFVENNKRLLGGIVQGIGLEYIQEKSSAAIDVTATPVEEDENDLPEYSGTNEFTNATNTVSASSFV